MNTFSRFEFTAFIGIDWSDTKHDICIQPGDTHEREFDRIAHQPATHRAVGTSKCTNALAAPSR